MKRIAVIDYGLGNLFSVLQAFKKFGCEATVVAKPSELTGFDGLVVPGVGAFGQAMSDLKSRGFDVAIKDWVNSGKPFLGICLGMQLLMDESDEFGHHAGLGIIHGRVKRFPQKIQDKELKVPRMGWAELNGSKASKALDNVEPGADMYFVHSYHVVLTNPEDELAWSEYEGHRYTSAIAHKNVWAFQFHPEKSGEAGLALLENWKSQL
jgi:glutamine amidotransferase